MLNDDECVLVAWVDKNAERLRELEFLPVKDMDALCSAKYDFIVVVVFDEIVYYTIRKELMNTGISEDVIIWNPTRYE